MLLSETCAPLQGIYQRSTTVTGRVVRPKPSGRIRRTAHPPELPSPTALEESGIRRSRAYHARHGPASAFRTLSPVCAPQNPPGLFHPGNAHGVRPSGPFPRKKHGPFRNRSSLAVPSRARPVRVSSERRLQRFDLSASPYRERVVEARPAADALLAFRPLGLSIPPPWDRLPGPSSRRARGER